MLAAAYTTAVERARRPPARPRPGAAGGAAVGRAAARPLALLERLADQEWAKTDPHLRVVLFTELATAQRDTGRLADARKSAYTALGDIGRPSSPARSSMSGCSAS
ncbi:hypothetical protein GCM10017744_023260 [Streptomyces antimycoticus]